MRRSSRPKPVLPHPNLIAKRSEIEAARKALLTLEVQWAEEAIRLVRELRFTASEDMTFGSWYCPESPTAACVYEDDLDPMHDNCLFCGDPEERG